MLGFYIKCDLEDMKLEDFYDLKDTECSIDKSIENNKKMLNDTNCGFSKEEVELHIKELESYKDKYGGDSLIAWTTDNCPDNADLIGLLIYKDGKILDAIPYA